MRVSEVNIAPVKPNNGLVGIASVVIDGNIYLNSIAIYTEVRWLVPTALPYENCWQ